MSDMDPKTLQALKESIVKWDRNARVRKEANANISPHNCPLCVIFTCGICDGCPVNSAGNFCCRNTPYNKAFGAWSSWTDGKTEGKAFRAAAKAEADFLRSLLPEGEAVE